MKLCRGDHQERTPAVYRVTSNGNSWDACADHASRAVRDGKASVVPLEAISSETNQEGPWPST